LITLETFEKKQESKEYILEMLQEGIMIISQKFENLQADISFNHNSKASELQPTFPIDKNDFQIEFINSFFK
jgi:hypothetical protein